MLLILTQKLAVLRFYHYIDCQNTKKVLVKVDTYERKPQTTPGCLERSTGITCSCCYCSLTRRGCLFVYRCST